MTSETIALSSKSGNCFTKPTDEDGRSFNPYENCTVSSVLRDIGIKFLPIEKSMFSGLTHLPKNLSEVNADDLPCPDDQGLQSQPSNLLITRLVKYKEFKKSQGDGSDAIPFKIFLNSYNGQMNQGRQVSLLEREKTPEMKSMQVQTDFRESQTQTDPYSPDYFIRTGTRPELLSIAMLSYGCGLPAGLAEVEMIERARQKREWEAEQEMLSEKCQIDKKRKKIEEQHAKEWALRDAEIEKILGLRLMLTMKMLQVREQQNNEKYNKRLEVLWSLKEDEGQKRLAKLKYDNLRAIRKITAKQCKVEKKKVTRDITKEYSDFGSQAFAPLTRVGVFFDKNASKYEIGSHYLNSYSGILELEAHLDRTVLNKDLDQYTLIPRSTSVFLKKNRKKEKELELIYESIQKERHLPHKSPQPLRFLQKIEKPMVRAPTPVLEVESEEVQNVDLAATFLQQMIRGRHLQMTMLKGKEERIELIKELKSTNALMKSEQEVLDAHRSNTVTLQKQKLHFDAKEDVVDGILSELEGETLADSLDFLTKELERLKEERRIEAFAMLAERNRRMREAEESGMRQIEERKRRGADEAFKQVVKVHQDTVDSYLEDIILSTIERSADEDARKEIQEIANKIDEAAHKAENSRSILDSEEIVAQLVHGFLLPEIHKQMSKDKIVTEQKKYLETAHKMLHGQDK